MLDYCKVLERYACVTLGFLGGGNYLVASYLSCASSWDFLAGTLHDKQVLPAGGSGRYNRLNAIVLKVKTGKRCISECCQHNLVLHAAAQLATCASC